MLLFFILPLTCAHRIPPPSITSNSMGHCMLCILEYAQKYDAPPESLDVLLDEPDSQCEIEDAWGRKIVYQVNPDETVTLTSYGKDGIKGGDGDNTDLIGIFPLKTKSGRWEGNYCKWLKYPLETYHNQRLNSDGLPPAD